VRRRGRTSLQDDNYLTERPESPSNLQTCSWRHFVPAPFCSHSTDRLFEQDMRQQSIRRLTPRFVLRQPDCASL
jgi:hypothetical protein